MTNKPELNKKSMEKEIRITELDRLYSPDGWYKAVAVNRLRKGWIFYKDITNDDWVLIYDQQTKSK
jgi:hypothetical protein